MMKAAPQLEKSTVMVVDAAPAQLAVLTEMLLRSGAEVSAFSNCALALMAAERTPPDLFLLDADMPDSDCHQVCSRIKRHPKLKDIPVIFLSSAGAAEENVRTFLSGAVDYIVKPLRFEEVQARVQTHLSLRSLQAKLHYQDVHLQRLAREKVREISEAQHATIFALAKLAEQRDYDTGAHLERVREYCRLLAEQLGKDSAYVSHINAEFIECIQHASPLHDVGKVAIPDSILLKAGRLTIQEFEVMKTHTVIGAENMQTVFNRYPGNAFIGMGIEIALYHHEKWDGSGYPDGLAGRNIPLSARIMALADYYDALSSDRCYRHGYDHQQVKTMILEGNGTHFDPEIVTAFLAVEEEFRHVMTAIG